KATSTASSKLATCPTGIQLAERWQRWWATFRSSQPKIAALSPPTSNHCRRSKGRGILEDAHDRWTIAKSWPGLVPGIHLLLFFTRQRRGWPSPAMRVRIDYRQIALVSECLEGDDGVRILNPRDRLHLLVDEMADVGLLLDVELHQQVVIAGG